MELSDRKPQIHSILNDPSTETMSPPVLQAPWSLPQSDSSPSENHLPSDSSSTSASPETGAQAPTQQSVPGWSLPMIPPSNTDPAATPDPPVKRRACSKFHDKFFNL